MIDSRNSEKRVPSEISFRRKGSLPLKKRKVLFSSSMNPPELNERGPDVPFGSISQVNHSSSINRPKRDGEKIVELTSLASAESFSPSYILASLKNMPLSSAPFSNLSRFQESSEDSPSNMAMRRVQHPHLVNPLPNGCHGRTARNKSFCRRQPCYNGSKYCKLHYQQYCVSAKRASKGDGVPISSQYTGNSLCGGSLPVMPDIVNQDKRFTGAPDQMRCQATTTRGRPCAYVSVNSTMYCHLHVEYGKAPPPRRHSTASNFPNMILNEGRLSIMGGRVGGTSSNDSAIPLLSALPTGKWLHKVVIVASGPLQNHCGSVERWGNGWVSVRIPGVGLHNRRSFELYLHPSNNSKPNETTITTTSCLLPNKPNPENVSKVSSLSSEVDSESSGDRSFSESPIHTASLAPVGVVSPHTPYSFQQQVSSMS